MSLGRTDHDRREQEPPTRPKPARPAPVGGGLNRHLHGLRTIRQYGYQWLRSYARNATVAIFQKQDLILEDGMFCLQEMRNSPDLAHIAELKLNAKGWDICADERFADQLRGGVNATPTCAGTLIDKNLILTAAHCLRETGDPLGADNFDVRPVGSWRR